MEDTRKRLHRRDRARLMVRASYSRVAEFILTSRTVGVLAVACIIVGLFIIFTAH